MINNCRVGCYITIPSEIVAEIICNMPYDFIVVDLEHSVVSIEDAQNIIRIAQLYNKKSLVRVSSNNTVEIKKVLDAGADGIIVPMINTVEEAKQAIKNSFYPPVGIRGVGLARGQMYGKNFYSYLEKVKEKDIEIIVQFEHIDVMENVDEILSLDGINGFMIGPYDFTASMGIHGQFDNPLFLDKLTIINNINKKYKKTQGFHLIDPDPKAFRKLLNNKYNFVVYSIDTKHLNSSAEEIFNE